MITQEFVKSILDYNKNTGIFRWKVRRGCRGAVGAKTGSKDGHGYIQIKIDGERHLAHRIAWLYENGYWSENIIDHINRDRSDNRICNLREASTSCNARNANKRKDNESGVTGVYWDKRNKRWKSFICENGDKKHLGIFKSKLDAVKERFDAEEKYKYNKCKSDSSAYEYLKKYGAI